MERHDRLERRNDAGGDGLSLAVIVPELGRIGGAERLALQCVRRWQTRHRVTLYSQAYDERWLERHGIGAEVERRRLSAYLGPRPIGGHDQRVVEAATRPKAWSRELGAHDVYLAHQWPLHALERRPLVWYAHELHRLSTDLLLDLPDRHVTNELRDLLTPGDGLRPDRRLDVVAEVIRQLDRTASPDRVVANSHFTAAALADGLGRDDVDVVHPGVDPSAFREPSFDEPYFLCVGALHTHKRQRLAIEAISLLTGGRLVVAGGGPELPRLERMISILGLQDRVSLRADLDDEALRDLYAGCRAVVFTPLLEPFGMVALEAMAAGKPLVAVDEGGFTECVDASCAVLTPPEPAALAEALRALLANPEDARRMGQAGRKLAETFSWDRTAAELETILLEAAAAAREGAPPRRRVGPGSETSDPFDLPQIGVRVLCDYGDGVGQGAWRRAPRADAMPRAGHYASHHASTIRRQLSEIEACGFDFVTLVLSVDAWRLSARGAATLRNLLALAPEPDGRLRFCPELLLEKPTASILAHALDWVAEQLRGHEERLILEGGRPLLLLRPAPDPTAFPEPLPEHPDLCVRRADAVPCVEAEAGSDWAAALRAHVEATARVLVSSWNEHATDHALEPTARHGDERIAEARAVLASVKAG